MANLTLTLTMRGEPPVSLEISPAIEVAFERQYQRSLGGELWREHLYWLAWKQYHKDGHEVKPFDDWLEMVDDVTPAENVPKDTSVPSEEPSPGSASPPA